MAYTHVIFDLDGTLLNTLEDLATAGNTVCAAHGWPTFPVDAYRYKVGNGMTRLVERILPAELAGNQDVLDQALAEFRAFYGKHSEDHTGPYPGIPELLKQLQTTDATLAVLSNKDHGAVQTLVKRFFGQDVFACVQGRIDAYPPKPAAPITLHVLEQLGAAPETTLYVGDSNVDVTCGHNAGLVVAGVTWGFRGREELEKEGADYIVDTPDELLALIK